MFNSVRAMQPENLRRCARVHHGGFARSLCTPLERIDKNVSDCISTKSVSLIISEYSLISSGDTPTLLLRLMFHWFPPVNVRLHRDVPNFLRLRRWNYRLPRDLDAMTLVCGKWKGPGSTSGWYFSQQLNIGIPYTKCILETCPGDVWISLGHPKRGCILSIWE